MNDEDIERVLLKLKSGEYDGVDIMYAWVALEELLVLREQLRSTPST